MLTLDRAPVVRWSQPDTLLVYADWLADNGHDDRAALYRGVGLCRVKAPSARALLRPTVKSPNRSWTVCHQTDYLTDGRLAWYAPQDMAGRAIHRADRQCWRDLLDAHCARRPEDRDWLTYPGRAGSGHRHLASAMPGTPGQALTRVGRSYPETKYRYPCVELSGPGAGPFAISALYLAFVLRRWPQAIPRSTARADVVAFTAPLTVAILAPMLINDK